MADEPNYADLTLKYSQFLMFGREEFRRRAQPGSEPMHFREGCRVVLKYHFPDGDFPDPVLDSILSMASAHWKPSAAAAEPQDIQGLLGGVVAVFERKRTREGTFRVPITRRAHALFDALASVTDDLIWHGDSATPRKRYGYLKIEITNQPGWREGNQMGEHFSGNGVTLLRHLGAFLVQLMEDRYSLDGTAWTADRTLEILGLKPHNKTRRTAEAIMDLFTTARFTVSMKRKRFTIDPLIRLDTDGGERTLMPTRAWYPRPSDEVSHAGNHETYVPRRLLHLDHTDGPAYQLMIRLTRLWRTERASATIPYEWISNLVPVERASARQSRILKTLKKLHKMRLIAPVAPEPEAGDKPRIDLNWLNEVVASGPSPDMSEETLEGFRKLHAWAQVLGLIDPHTGKVVPQKWEEDGKEFENKEPYVELPRLIRYTPFAELTAGKPSDSIAIDPDLWTLRPEEDEMPAAWTTQAAIVLESMERIAERFPGGAAGIAELCGVGVEYVERILDGEFPPSGPLIRALAAHPRIIEYMGGVNAEV